jgi:hypothetical protein
MHPTRRLGHSLAVVVLLAPLTLAAQPARPTTPVPASGPGGGSLPDATAFLRQVRSHLRLDRAGLPAYACEERDTEVKLDDEGRPTSTSTLVYEFFPASAGAAPYRRLVSRDGVPLTAAELAENDRRIRADRERRAVERGREAPADRARRLQREAGRRRDQEAVADEVFRVLDIRLVGREWIAGRPTLVFTLAPRPNVQAVTRVAAMAQKFAGRAWVDEQDFEVVRLEAHAIDDVTYGLGIFARIYKGTTVTAERQKLNGDAWVPVRFDVRANARVLLFRRLGIHRTTDYFNYQPSASTMSASGAAR